MPVSAIDTLLAALRESQVLRPAQLEELEQSAGRFSDPRGLAQFLLERDWLTPFQVNQLCRGGDLVLGPYLLLERLGEGYSGQVYKARHLRMNRVVALKVIRPELLGDATGIERFYREVEATSQLSHPHVIHAFDAGPIGPTHCLVREYLDGTDLERLVQEKGPLPAAQACRYLCQAALGLQHAHAHGLVHGSIKPSKLLLTQVADSEGRPQPAVKLLDIGLAWLYRSADGQALHGRLRDLGVASTEFLAPEQLNDGQMVDIRADIYSLGCTLYYLLSAQVPDRDQLRPIEQLRPDLPADVAVIVRHMMAASPAERYDTPIEVFRALAEFAGDDAGEAFAGLAEDAGPRRGRTPWTRWALIGGSSLLLVVLLVVFFNLVSAGPSQRATPTDDRLQIVMPHWLDGKAVRAKVKLPDLAAVLKHGNGPVRRLAFNARDNLLASGGEDGVIKIWDWTTGQDLGDLHGHNKPVLAVAWAPDGSYIASAGRDKKIRIWDRALFYEEHALGVQTEWVRALAISPDGRYLAARWKIQEAKVWELPGYREIQTIGNNNQSITSAAFAPDSKLLALGSVENLVRLVPIASQDNPALLKGHARDVKSVAFSPDGQLLLTGSDDRTVKLWDVASGQERASFNRHAAAVNRAIWSPDGGRAASAAGNQLLVWRPGDQVVLKEWKLPGPIDDLAFAPNSQHILAACDNGTVYIFRLTP